MKLRETEFFQQYTAVVAGTFLLVMTLSFMSIPFTVNLPDHSAGSVVRSLFVK